STAPSFGTRSRTWPYEARTTKSLPRYLLIVRALAGDSTMRRFLAMAESVSWGRPGGLPGGARRQRPGRTPGETLLIGKGRNGERSSGPPPGPALVHRLGLVHEHLRFHPGVGRLGAGLVEQGHQHDPFQVLEVQLVLVQGHRAVHDQLALVRV